MSKRDILRIHIKTPSRLHFGIIDLSRSLGRSYGSVGLAIEGLGYEILAEKGEELKVLGPEKDAEQARKIAEKVTQIYNIPHQVKINILKRIPMHVGLGSTTQLTLAVATAITKLYGVKASSVELAEKMGRGKNSGVGTYAFMNGGFIVDGGIIGARVSAKGNINARFIHSSQVSAVGDIIVKKEIIDSKIETGGNLIAIPYGKVFTAQVIAKRGITAGQIGSESSKPCVLTIGVDCQTKEWIKKLQDEIALKEKERAKIKTSVGGLNVTSEQLEEKINKLAQIKEKALLEHGKLKKVIETVLEGKDSSLFEQAHYRLRQIEETLQKVEGELQKLVDQRDQVAQKMSLLHDEIKDFDGAIQGLQQEIERLTQDCSAKEIPAVKVHDGIFAGTTIQGLHSQMVLEETLWKAMISEKKVSKVDPEGHAIKVWEMSLSP